MINATDATFDQRLEALNRIDVGIASGILTTAMPDNLMSISELLDVIVAGKFIRMDDILSVSGNIVPDDRHDCPTLNVLNDLSDNLRGFPVDQPHYRGFALSTSPWFAVMLTTNIRFVYLGIAVKRIAFLIHQRANLLEHSPRCFVSHSEFPFKLFSRDTATSGAYQEHGMKPRAQRRGRFVEDGFGCRAYRMTTILTDVILSSDSVIVGGHLLAFRASYTLRIASLKQELKARIIIWKLVLKVFNRILFSCHFAPLCEYYNREVTVCQGIVTGNYTGRGRTAGDKGEKKGGRPDAIGTPREKNMERKVIMAHCGSVKAVFGFLRLLAVKFGEKTLGELANANL